MVCHCSNWAHNCAKHHQRLKHADDLLLGAASCYLNELSFQITQVNLLALESSNSGYNNWDGFDCHLRVPFVFGVTNPIIKELSFFASL